MRDDTKLIMVTTNTPCPEWTRGFPSAAWVVIRVDCLVHVLERQSGSDRHLQAVDGEESKVAAVVMGERVAVVCFGF